MTTPKMTLVTAAYDGAGGCGMKAVNRDAEVVWRTIFEAADRAGGNITLMPQSPALMMLVVGRIRPRLYSVSHDADDIEANPGMTFFVGEDGRCYPTSFAMLGMGIYEESARVSSGRILRFNARQQRLHTICANLWAQNLRKQGYLRSLTESLTNGEREGGGLECVTLKESLS